MAEQQGKDGISLTRQASSSPPPHPNPKACAHLVVLLSEATQPAAASVISCGIQLALLLAEEIQGPVLPFAKATTQAPMASKCLLVEKEAGSLAAPSSGPQGGMLFPVAQRSHRMLRFVQQENCEGTGQPPQSWSLA